MTETRVKLKDEDNDNTLRHKSTVIGNTAYTGNGRGHGILTVLTA